MLSLEAIERLKAIAAGRRPFLLATDLDGTLAPIVETPGDARVPPATLAVLDRLAPAIRVAVITGRDLNTARRMVASEHIIIVGSHGLETSGEDGLLPGVDRLGLAAALERVEQQVISAVPSAFLHVERKAISTAFHFRQTPELEQPLRRALAGLPASLRLREGRMVLEVLPNARGGKDQALRAIANHLKVKTILAMGDDATDVAMFRAARELEPGGVTVLLVGVSGGTETPAAIAELSDILLRSPDEALEALETVARALGV
ncbi:MAG: trehalose-phosphatase [Tepidiformaceae bacterium]